MATYHFCAMCVIEGAKQKHVSGMVRLDESKNNDLIRPDVCPEAYKQFCKELAKNASMETENFVLISLTRID